MVDSKSKLRLEMMRYLQNNKECLKKKEQEILQRLFHSKEWKNSDTIGITLSLSHEINSYPIIEKAWEEGKKIAVPKTIPEDHQLLFFKLNNFADLRRGYKNIYEPIEADSDFVSMNSMDMIIVPGLLYDYNGYRIGYGGGFFDRYLVDYRNVKVSILYEAQLKSRIPRDRFDIPIDILITENNYTLVRNN